ncbi:Autophagy- protein 17 [Emydomyces testavorans]|uniref:Autophagy-related protein 17 n=1 Tax=Emydomyces testavorans TaxID=2070801 RepID=A0AAF0DEL3_9EURO|nr:Autophagy- protein 17 [Emydomyces testavorans]
MSPSASIPSSPGVDGQFNAPATGDEHQQPDLEALVAHLVAAKRSLSSINHVWKANEIVTTARTALEEIVVLSARTGFLHRELEVQLRALFQIKDEIEQVAHYGRAEFSLTLKELDHVDEKLQEVLNLLRETNVETAFLPAGQKPKTLHDFVDEKAVQDLQTVLKDAIDNTNSAQVELDTSNNAFNEELDSIKRALSKHRGFANNLSSSFSSPTQSQSNKPSLAMIPELLHSLESHAQEMADLLESLVQHFDLCATAVKHTEGGGAAALRITGDLPNGLAIGVRHKNDGTDTDNPHASLEPITDSDYQEMLGVIVKDAAEAEDVVLEIQDRIAEMESTLDRILAERDLLSQTCATMVENVRHLDQFSKHKLPSFIAQARIFAQGWKQQHERMQAGMSDLSDLRLMYVGFLDAYDDLILEVARRKSVRSSVEKVLHEARAKLDKLYEDDVRAREAFRVELGDYLPSDIWPGLGRAPMKVEFRRIFDSKSDIDTGVSREVPISEAEPIHGGNLEGQEAVSAPVEDKQPLAETERPDVGSESIPDLPKYVVERALLRRKVKIKANHLPGATTQNHWKYM